jgi:hypothetical protein
MRTRPSPGSGIVGNRHPDAPAPRAAPDGAIGQVEQSLGRRRLRPRPFYADERQQIEAPVRFGEHDVGHGWREHDAPDVRVRATASNVSSAIA